MKLMCSWCLSEGRMAFLGVRGSIADSRVSHAICEGHLVQLRAESLPPTVPLLTQKEKPGMPSRTSMDF